MKTPKLYSKKDGAYYFTFQGKQRYAGKTLEKAQAKLREVTGLAPSGDTDVVALVGQSPSHAATLYTTVAESWYRRKK